MSVVSLDAKRRTRAKPQGSQVARCCRMLGDRNAGRLFSAILSWWPKATPKRGLSGRWNANPTRDLMRSARLTRWQYHAGRKLLLDAKAAEIEVHIFAGKKMVFTRPTALGMRVFEQGLTLWPSSEISKKPDDAPDDGPDDAPDDGPDDQLPSVHLSICPSVPLPGDSDVGEESLVGTGRESNQENHPYGAAVEPQRGVVDYVGRHKAEYPSTVPGDGEFLRLAAEWLKRIERQGAFQQGEEAECTAIRNRLEEIALAGEENHDGMDQLAAWAGRLCGEAHSLLEQFGAERPALTEDLFTVLDQYGTHEYDTAELVDDADPEPEPVEDSGTSTEIHQPGDVWDVTPEEVAEPVLAFVAERWPDRRFTVTATLRQARMRLNIGRRLMSATLDLLCDRGVLERDQRAYRLRQEQAR